MLCRGNAHDTLSTQTKVCISAPFPGSGGIGGLPLMVKARATVLELAAAGGWSSVSRFLWFIEGAAEGVQFDPPMLAEARALLLPVAQNTGDPPILCC